MAEIHLDHPGEITWFKGYGPAAVIGPCPHSQCRHLDQSVIAWGPDLNHYELVTCDVGEECNRFCRAWVNGKMISTTPWLEVAR